MGRVRGGVIGQVPLGSTLHAGRIAGSVLGVNIGRGVKKAE